MIEVPTREKLAQALEKEDAPKWIIHKARVGYYDEFSEDSPLAFPMTQLYNDLISVKMHNMASRIANGEFDATAEESAAWAKSEEGKATFAQFFKPKKD